MAKKVLVEVRGRMVRVMEHMLEDVLRPEFGAVYSKKTIKETPKELLKVTEPPKDLLPKMETVTLPPAEEPKEEPKKRKAPVRSKSIKK